MILPIALLHNEGGKLIAVRYLKFDAPIPNCQAYANKDFNEIITYKPTQNILMNTSIVEIPIETFRANNKSTLKNLRGITKLNSNGAPSSESAEYVQIITCKELYQHYYEALVQSLNYELDRLSYRSSAGSARRELELEYELRQLVANPELCNRSRIYADNNRTIFDRDAICTVNAVDYTGKVFNLPLVTVTQLAEKGTIKVGNMELVQHRRKLTLSDVDNQYASYYNEYTLPLMSSDASVFNENLQVQGTLLGYGQSYANVFNDNAIPSGAPFVLIPQGIAKLDLRERHEGLVSITCPKIMNSVACKLGDMHLKSFASPQEVTHDFALTAGSVQTLVLPAKLTTNRPVSNYVYSNIGFSLRLGTFYGDKIGFEESQIPKYQFDIKESPNLTNVTLPFRQDNDFGSTGLSVLHFGTAPNLNTIMVHRAKGTQVKKALVELAVSARCKEYTIDCRIPLKRLHISFPEGITGAKVFVRHCGINKVTFFTDKEGNTVELIPQVVEAKINYTGYARVRERWGCHYDTEDAPKGSMPPVHILRRRYKE